MKKYRFAVFAVLYALLLCAAALWLLARAGAGALVETDLDALLPADKALNAAQKRAADSSQAALNRQLLLLTGATLPENAFQAASEIAAQWRASGLFAQVRESTVPDLAQTAAELSALDIALLPEADAVLLRDNPQAFFTCRAREIANPFAASFIAPDRDWLGFSAASLARLENVSGSLKWDAASGKISTRHGGKTWVLTAVTLPESQGVINVPPQILPLIAQSETIAARYQAEFLAAGGAVFAAEGRASGERESRLMGTAGAVLTLLLLFSVLRSARAVWVFVAPLAGLIAGTAAVAAFFGTVHILTLVIGTSLLGVLVDFPLHWLAKSTAGNFHPRRAMCSVVPVFSVSLAVTVSGYLALFFTPLPVLRESAVFSAVALAASFAATVLFLPPLFARGKTALSPRFVRAADGFFRFVGQCRLFCAKHRAAAVLPAALLFAGIVSANWQDDIAQWVSAPPERVRQAAAAAEITRMGAEGQFLLVTGKNTAEILQRQSEVSAGLENLRRTGALDGYQSLSQWIRPPAAQRQLQTTLENLRARPETRAALHAVGVPEENLQAALKRAAQKPAVTLEDALKTALAEPYRALWLGFTDDGTAVSVIRLFGIHDTAALARLAENTAHAELVNPRARLNRLFDQTRTAALWLKLASYLFAFALLARFFKVSGSLKILAVPLAAALATLAVLGWAQVTVTFFTVFGLLLVSAVGVDYAVYAAHADTRDTEKHCAVVLSALTTAVSFALLAFSGTAAIAGFGLSVALGTLFNAFFTAWVFGRKVQAA